MVIPWAPHRQELPEKPGVYRFFDKTGRIIYVGKAKKLRDRLGSYFTGFDSLPEKTQRMLQEAVRVEWTVVQTEVEALILEQQWIHQEDPRFNIRLRDGKVYPSIAVSVNEDVPRLMVWRGKRAKGIRYFGPFPAGSDVYEILESLERAFLVRSCRVGTYLRAQREKRPCLLADIGKCSAPCVGRIKPADYDKRVEDLIAFMEGRDLSILERLEEEMQEAAKELEFEKAARRRDDKLAVQRTLSKQNVVFEDDTDGDVFMCAEDGLMECWYGLFIRGGIVRGVSSYLVEGSDGDEKEKTRAFAERMISERTSGGYGLSNVVVLPIKIEHEALSEIIKEKTGKKGEFVSARGKWAEIAKTAKSNAEEVLASLKAKRAIDPKSREDALTELQDALGLPVSPLRIECYDISHNQGESAVGSMVVFEEGLPKKSMYRSFNVSDTNAGNDLGSMKEVLTRRFTRAKATEAGVDPKTGEVLGAKDLEAARRFALAPQLLLIDGGPEQVKAVVSVINELDVDVAVVGLAKRLEELWLPEEEYPVILPRNSEALYLVQRLRDEAHRFAITHHRSKVRKKMSTSRLDTVPGLGPKMRTKLLSEFKSVKKIQAATVQDLQRLDGIGPKLAQVIVDSLK